MHKKSQAAMEFLMTYGWALLVVLIAIAALAFFGLLNPDRFLPDKVTVSDSRIQIIPTQSNSLIIKNAGSDTLYDLQVNMTNHNCMISPANTISPGESKRFTIICSDTPPRDSRLKGDIRINYSTVSMGYTVQKTATAFYAVRGNYFSSTGLVGYWPLDGNADDYSGNGNTGTNMGATATSGKMSGAYTFDGTINDYIETTAYNGIGGANPRTISTWFKVGTWTDAVTIWGYGRGTGNTRTVFELIENAPPDHGFYLHFSNGVLQTIKLDFIAGQWYNLVATYDGTTAKIYIDGVLDCQGNFALNTNTASSFTIGKKNPWWSNNWIGDIDEVMLFNRVLSADEIKALAQS